MTRRTPWIAYTLAALAALALRAAPAAAQDEGFVVIVNTANPVTSLTRQQVADIFMKHTTHWEHGGDVHPVDQPAVADVRDAFSRVVHGKPASAVASWWGQQMFSGRAVPPPQRSTDRAVVTFVREDALAIGYVNPGTAGAEVKTIHITP
jgi:ABC-type phosphate transport system substrate-binding protein